MKKYILLGLAVILVLAGTACKKKKDGERCGETEIKVATMPAIGTIDPPQPGPSFPLTVNVETMPPGGVSIVVSARQEGSSAAPFFTETRKNVTMSSTSFVINNTPATVSCVVDITVTSSTCNSNTWKGSYRYSSK